MGGYCACVAPPTAMETTISYSKEIMGKNSKQITSTNERRATAL